MHNHLTLKTGAGGSGVDGGVGGHGGEAPFQLHYNHYGPQVIYMYPTSNQATTAAAATLAYPMTSANERADNRAEYNANASAAAWDDARLSNVPQYTAKLEYFRSQPPLLSPPGTCHINIRRSHIFVDSYMEIMRQNPIDLKKRLVIRFNGEDDLNDGDLSRGFFLLLSHHMFNPFYRLFDYSTVGRYKLQINPTSGADPEYLRYFRFIGRCLGLVVFHQHFLDVSFVVSFYKIILNKKITLSDLESIDARLFRDMNWILKNKITGDLDKTFSTTHLGPRGESVTFELKESGRDIPVTEENKEEYVEAIIHYHYWRCIRQQSDALVYGFSELIPQKLMSSIFDERELELLISRFPDIDVDDWMEFTDYWGYGKDDEVIQWFWYLIRSWPSEQRSRLLKFATGTPRIPINEFRDLRGSDGPRRFKIAKLGHPMALPKSQVSTNTIELPPYEDYAMLEQQLSLVVQATAGFDLE